MPEKIRPWPGKWPTPWLQGLAIILVLQALAPAALAHRVLVFAYGEGDAIHTESKFVPDTPVRQGKVMVQDQKTGQTLVSGQTDDQGKFSFKIPATAAAEKLNLIIITEAAMGHRGEWLLKADSYLSGVPSAALPSPAGVTPAPAGSPTDTGKMPALPVKEAPSGGQGNQAAKLDQQALEAALNKALERQLAPIKEMLTQLTVHRTSLTDILGGIGYILGFFGLWAYFQSKRQKDS
jgi:nickel transport protein